MVMGTQCRAIHTAHAPTDNTHTTHDRGKERGARGGSNERKIYICVKNTNALMNSARVGEESIRYTEGMCIAQNVQHTHPQACIDNQFTLSGKIPDGYNRGIIVHKMNIARGMDVE